MAFDFGLLAIGDIVTSSKGAKSAPITSDGAPATCTMPPMRVAFEPSAYGDSEATRVTVVFRPDPDTIAKLELIDEGILREACMQSLRLFGKKKTVEQLSETYTPIVKFCDSYPSTFKAKLNLKPPAAVKIWDSQRQPREAPAQWRDSLVAPRIRLRSIYFMGGQWGCVLERTDAMVSEEETVECPFRPYRPHIGSRGQARENSIGRLFKNATI